MKFFCTIFIFSTKTCHYYKYKIKGCGSYKRRHFQNTKLLVGNDHVIDIFTSEDTEIVTRYTKADSGHVKIVIIDLMI